jgi:hypothetical protein
MTSIQRSYFEEMYASDPDPWNFATSPYEHRKYSLTMASLPYPRYRSGFEPGCSIGVLTEKLATRCDRLLTTEVIAVARDKARRRLAGWPNVRVEDRAIPEDWPTDEFDLIVLSEIAYYFDATDLTEIVARVVASTQPGAHVVGVHWRGDTNYPLSGDHAHELIGGNARLDNVVHHLEREFVLDVWERRA